MPIEPSLETIWSLNANNIRRSAQSRLCSLFFNSVRRCLFTITLRLDLDDERMMDQAIYCCHRHHRVTENTIPLREGMIGRNQQRPLKESNVSSFTQQASYSF